MWREMIKPRLEKMFASSTKGLPIIMHSDGAIAAIIPDLVEIGLTVLNPVQPEVVDHDWLHQTFSGLLAFYGGI
jgi:uroporphyrinogen decarboxylase